ncbi:MAG: polysaccharide biosynthesis tyrosine autokinase, partial [Acidobacteriota bacterium]|nr:polysaccharide biosynthesis tyrosine autokinase [Acidobacteriota bacterium]
VKSLAAQISELEGMLKKEQSNILQRIYNEYQSAAGREKLLQQSYNQQTKVMSHQAAASVHYDTLKREVDTNRTLYDAMLQKIKEAGIASTVRASNIRIINRATAPARPFRPKPLWNAATGWLAGFFLAAAFVLIRDQTDRTLRQPGDAPSHLKVPELGAIPSSGSGFDGLALRVGGRRSRRGSKKSAGAGPAEWVRSGSRMAEAFRSALASLWFTDNQRMRVFAVTSPNSGDGKSTVVSHLGVTMANAKRRVLLMDGDLRRPVLHRMFGVENRLGLGGILEESRPINDYKFDELFQDTEVPELFILPGGSGMSNVASLRFYDRLIELMARIRLEFDVVLMDTPPAIEYADARILGGLSDGVILVLRAARTSRNAAWVTVRRFQDDGATIAGTILNDWSCRDSRYDLGAFRQNSDPRGDGQQFNLRAGSLG